MFVKQRDEKNKNAAQLYEAYKTKRDHTMEFIGKGNLVCFNNNSVSRLTIMLLSNRTRAGLFHQAPNGD